MRRRFRISVALALVVLVFAPTVRGQERISIKLSSTHFSPNSDGMKDVLRIEPAKMPDGLEEPADWSLDILDSNDQSVRLYQADHRRLRVERGLGNLFLPDDDELEPLRLFRSILWDGRNEAGQFVSDGVYQIILRVRDPRTQITHSSLPMTVIVDTQAPELELQPVVSALILREGTQPTRDERLELLQSASSESGTTYLANVRNGIGEVVRQKEWSTGLPRRVFVYWDELAEDRSPNEIYDVYSYEIIATDPAGNRSIASYPHLLVQPEAPTLDLRSENYAFSPNADGVRDGIAFELVGLNANGIPQRQNGVAARWQFEIRNAEGTSVYYTQEGSGAFPQRIEWDGRDDSGDIIDDGVYTAAFWSLSWTTAFRPIIVDTEPPEISVSLRNANPVPGAIDASGTVIVDTALEDTSGIDRWSVSLVLEPEIDPGEGAADRFYLPFRSYVSANGLAPAAIPWPGRSDEGHSMESLERFIVVINAFDRAGNRATNDLAEITGAVGIHALRPDGNVLVARLPLQAYFDEEHELTTRGARALDEVLKRLERYGTYNVQVELHSSLPGTEEFNLRRTEKRAWSAFQYVSARGDVPGHALSFRGHGESEALLRGLKDFDHYRNERIEVRLSGRRQRTASD